MPNNIPSPPQTKPTVLKQHRPLPLQPLPRKPKKPKPHITYHSPPNTKLTSSNQHTPHHTPAQGRVRAWAARPCAKNLDNPHQPKTTGREKHTQLIVNPKPVNNPQPTRCISCTDHNRPQAPTTGMSPPLTKKGGVLNSGLPVISLPIMPTAVSLPGFPARGGFAPPGGCGLDQPEPAVLHSSPPCGGEKNLTLQLLFFLHEQGGVHFGEEQGHSLPVDNTLPSCGQE